VSAEDTVRAVLEFAEEALVPKQYRVLADIVTDLVALGLHKALEERLHIDTLDIKIAAATVYSKTGRAREKSE